MKNTLVFVTFCLVVGVARAAAPCDAIRPTDAWIREPPPVAKLAAGYLRLENQGDQTAIIDHVESDCCAGVTMHETLVDGDQMRMSRIKALVLKPREIISFAPGGLHLMLISPFAPIGHGQVVELEFFCLQGGSFRAEFDVLTVR